MTNNQILKSYLNGCIELCLEDIKFFKKVPNCADMVGFFEGKVEAYQLCLKRLADSRSLAPQRFDSENQVHQKLMDLRNRRAEVKSYGLDTKDLDDMIAELEGAEHDFFPLFKKADDVLLHSIGRMALHTGKSIYEV